MVIQMVLFYVAYLMILLVYIDQGGGKRNGSFQTIYLEPWHADIEDLELKKNHGNEHERARFYGLWIPVFMKRGKREWSLVTNVSPTDSWFE